MSSLREIKDRIGSVRSTLKITSAMKLVASSKLRKAQRTIEGLRPYEKALNEILSEVISGEYGSSTYCKTSASLHPSQPDGWAPPVHEVTGDHGFTAGTTDRIEKDIESGCYKIAVVAVASNSSLCGGFNANVIKKALQTVSEYEQEGFEVEVHSLGRKMAEAMRKAGYDSPEDYSDLVAKPEYAKSCALASTLSKRFDEGRLGGIVLVYNHFVSTSKQEAVVEQYLPFPTGSSSVGFEQMTAESEYIIEPSKTEVVRTLMPQVLMLKFHSAVLDSAAAEHAARTVAMQTATDNAQDLLGELTLEYNKGRQQKITSEILDLLGGATQ